MRPILALPFVIACTSPSPGAVTATYDSVRDRLTSEPALLQVEPGRSAGSITASRYAPDGWHPGTTAFSISNGDIIATADPAGEVAITDLGANVDPIEIPQDVFGKPARLQDLRIQLASRLTSMTTWADDNSATVTATIDLDVSWSIAIEDAVLQLSRQRLRALPVELSISGDGDHVDATLSVHGSGELWSWAGIVKLTDLELTLDAATVD